MAVEVSFEVSVELIFEDLLGAMVARSAQQAGSFWTSVWSGFGASVQAVDEEAGASQQVRRILDEAAAHCETCPPKERIYESWDAMLLVTGGLPGDGSDNCFSNCRCRLQFERSDGTWSSFFD